MDSIEPTIPDERLWISYSRKWAFPISALTSPILHVAILVLIVAFTLIGSRSDDSIDLEPVVIAEAPGGGNHGQDESTKPGLVHGNDVSESLANNPRIPLPNLPTESTPLVKPQHQPDPIQKSDEVDVNASIERKVANTAPFQSLKPLLRGFDGVGGTASANVGRGNGHGTGTGPGEGPGNGSAGGQLSQKQKRQLRWTLLFNIKSAGDYLDQLTRMNAMIGFQYPDKSIRIIRDLSRRPARLEPGERAPDRIFWMDDNPEAVRTMAAELGIVEMPWRVIAFFPANIEEELLHKEHAYGLQFGRESEDQILETVFNVTNKFGIIDISVLRQDGKK